MSILSDSLKELQNPRRRPSNFRIWLDSLSDEDRNLAIDALVGNVIKNYPLYDAFRKAGMKVSKDTFVALRTDLQSGVIKVEDIV